MDCCACHRFRFAARLHCRGDSCPCHNGSSRAPASALQCLALPLRHSVHFHCLSNHCRRTAYQCRRFALRGSATAVLIFAVATLSYQCSTIASPVCAQLHLCTSLLFKASARRFDALLFPCVTLRICSNAHRGFPTHCFALAVPCNSVPFPTISLPSPRQSVRCRFHAAAGQGVSKEFNAYAVQSVSTRRRCFSRLIFAIAPLYVAKPMLCASVPDRRRANRNNTVAWQI